jgi:hypothetical protein
MCAILDKDFEQNVFILVIDWVLVESGAATSCHNPTSQLHLPPIQSSLIFAICQVHCPPRMHPMIPYIVRKASTMAKSLVHPNQLRCIPILHLLLGLEVVEKDRSLLRLLTPVLDDNA